MPASCFGPGTLAYELVYGKGLTPFLRLAQQAGQGELDDGLRKAIINFGGELLRLPAAAGESAALAELQHLLHVVVRLDGAFASRAPRGVSILMPMSTTTLVGCTSLTTFTGVGETLFSTVTPGAGKLLVIDTAGWWLWMVSCIGSAGGCGAGCAQWPSIFERKSRLRSF